MKNLKFIRNLLQSESERLGTNLEYEVKEVFQDYGAGIKHTTIVATRMDGSSWQIFSPRDISEINSGCYTNKQFMELVDKHCEMAR